MNANGGREGKEGLHFVQSKVYCCCEPGGAEGDTNWSSGELVAVLLSWWEMNFSIDFHGEEGQTH